MEGHLHVASLPSICLSICLFSILYGLTPQEWKVKKFKFGGNVASETSGAIFVQILNGMQSSDSKWLVSNERKVAESPKLM